MRGDNSDPCTQGAQPTISLSPSNYVMIPREGDTELLNFHSVVHYFPKLIAIATILINVCYFMADLLTTLLFEPSRQTGKKYTIKMIQFIKEKKIT